MSYRGHYGHRARPDLPLPACQVKLVCGPPASGKSTYVNQNKSSHDIVIDLDLIAREKGFGRIRPASAVGPLLDERNRRLAALAQQPKDCVAWFITGGPGEGLRRWWCSTLNVRPSDLIVLTPSREELVRRIRSDADRQAVQALHMRLVDQWFERERNNSVGYPDQHSDQHGPVGQWYWTYRWKQRSKAHLREHPLCVMCAAKGRVTVATVADHIEPHRGDWNAFCLGKLQSLCRPCHNSAKRYEELRGYDRAIGADGWPIDPKHPTYRT